MAVSALTNIRCVHLQASDRHAIVDPLPVPALAIAFDYQDYDYEDTDAHTMTSKYGVNSTMNTSSSPRWSSSSSQIRKASSGGGPPSSGGGGSGGSGKQKCPKCGMSATFKHSDFEDNAFYCATCSGWFLVKDGSVSANVGGVISAVSQKNIGSVYGAFKDTAGSYEKRPSSPKILMQHVSKLFVGLSVGEIHCFGFEDSC